MEASLANIEIMKALSKDSDLFHIDLTIPESEFFGATIHTALCESNFHTFPSQLPYIYTNPHALHIVAGPIHYLDLQSLLFPTGCQTALSHFLLAARLCHPLTFHVYIYGLFPSAIHFTLEMETVRFFVGILTEHYAASQPKNSQLASSLLWEPQISMYTLL
jgi:hypothetical protein